MLYFSSLLDISNEEKRQIQLWILEDFLLNKKHSFYVDASAEC